MASVNWWSKLTSTAVSFIPGKGNQPCKATWQEAPKCIVSFSNSALGTCLAHIKIFVWNYWLTEMYLPEGQICALNKSYILILNN